MLFKKLTIGQKLYMGFGIITLLMLSILGYTYLNFIKVSQVVDINLTTYKVLQESDGIMTNLVGMENSTRGYIITGDQRYLDYFIEKKNNFHSNFNTLTGLVSKNEQQSILLKAFDIQFNDWLEIETSIQEKKKSELKYDLDPLNEDNSSMQMQPNYNVPGGFADYMPSNDAAGLIRTGKSRLLMDNLQNMLDNIVTEEKMVLKVKSENLKEIEIKTFKAILFGGMILVIITSMIAFFYSHSITKPIKMLVSSTKSITRNRYLQPIKLKADRDLGVLINTFNVMQSAVEIRESELKRKNDEIKAKLAEINEANKLKSQFLANMSHELRTPLNSIIGFTARVIRKCGDILPVVQLENLKIVKEEADHLLGLINDLLDYSKLEAGKMSLHMESFILVEIIEEVSNMVKPLIAGKELRYLYESKEIENIIIYSDRTKLKQILINLLSNAIKYSEKGIIRLSVERTEKEYCIKVEDEGIGIAPENVTNIFDEFRQVDGTYTRKVGGTGLGLSITKKFTEMLGGRIEVESALGVGSCFKVFLPVTLPLSDMGKSIEVIMPENNITCKTVAFLDDDVNIQRLYHQYLHDQGFETVALDTHEDIVARVREIKPLAVLLDIMLPKKDGWQVLTELKNDNETSSIPVIVISVLSEKNLAFRMKADDYLIKPFSQEDLVNSIHRILEPVEGGNA
jgi:Signal transduction histidine kinase